MSHRRTFLAQSQWCLIGKEIWTSSNIKYMTQKSKSYLHPLNSDDSRAESHWHHQQQVVKWRCGQCSEKTTSISKERKKTKSMNNTKHKCQLRITLEINRRCRWSSRINHKALFFFILTNEISSDLSAQPAWSNKHRFIGTKPCSFCIASS